MTAKIVEYQEADLAFQALTDVIKTHSKKDAFFLLALSGGIDSMMLLHALVCLNKNIPFTLHALHVHHGLSQNADDWTAFCTKQCALLNVPLKIVHVNINKQSALGVEAEARALRYQALMQYQQGEISPDFILTAHHQNDQAETLLLQLFRGAGVKGLASMAIIDEKRRLLRPLLEVSQDAIAAYAKKNQLQWCEDDSNKNIAFERNFLRLEVLPILEKRMPAIHRVLSRTATHFAEAQVLLEELAMIDSQQLIENNSLCLKGLALLSEARAKNLLRGWFATWHISMPNTEHLNEILVQLLHAKSDAKVTIQLQAFSLKRYQARAYLVKPLPVVDFDILWHGESTLDLPNGSQLHFKEATGKGLALAFGHEKLRITNRKGGERFKPSGDRPTRTLKHLLQEANMPPWQRDQLPLIYWQDDLAFVPEIGILHDLQTKKDAVGIEIIWQCR